jgi:hypothetical protein
VLLLFISELVLSVSSAAGAMAAATSAFMLTPVLAPRWSLSIIEALSVPLAVVGALIFWLIIPMAGSVKVSGVSAAVVDSCGLTLFSR